MKRFDPPPLLTRLKEFEDFARATNKIQEMFFYQNLGIEITRLLAIEAAAKEIANGFIVPSYQAGTYRCKKCCSISAPLGQIKHNEGCPVDLVINPIGDKTL